ncbi:hypothetical protein [Streptomyces sp. Amel2xC10]|uniref:hypothetical protein n=1 Tax=Streptomyces sp. Amel2xC10 TaxID=1305826 RepID=UPI000A0841B4|nr:hypothetical protein [Streptomyces sp. Amel2xC10]SME91511.1 hypothetical protein SAMN02745830_00421 [Streptomyces sp. Amel2xC10]
MDHTPPHDPHSAVDTATRLGSGEDRIGWSQSLRVALQRMDHDTEAGKAFHRAAERPSHWAPFVLVGDG